METLEYVGNIEKLRVLAKVDQSIYNILNDASIGRGTVAKQLAAKGLSVSEKLVRNYRNTPEPTMRKVLEYVQERYGAPTYTDTRGQVHTVPGYISGGSVAVAYEEKSNVIQFPVHKEKARTIVVMPDVQAPLHDVALMNKFIQFIGDYEPDELAQVGDFTDSTEISRWVRGKKTEYAGDLQEGFNTAKDILKNIREVFSGRIRVVRSNHDDRLELYIESCAPGLASLDALSIEHLAGFNEFDVEFVRNEVVELAPGWVMAHGDEGALSPSAGKTAFGLAKNKFGVSTVCGHTHRAGLTSETTGYNGKIHQTLTGLEVGHFMDITKADYLKKKGVAANWQQAFGILEVYGNRVYPKLVTVQDGYFSVDGVQY